MADWAALFDMDGVIADTNPLHRASWRAFLVDHGIELGEEEIGRRVYGRTNKDCLRDLFGQDLPMERLVELAEEKEALFREMAKGALAPVPGLIDFVAALGREGAALAVATSAPPENAVLTLAETGLADAFPVVVDETGVSRGKPAPDVYLAAARAVGVHPSRCVVFEDSLSGIQSARNAGMAVIGLATTHTLEEIRPLTDDCGPDFLDFTPRRARAVLGGKGRHG